MWMVVTVRADIDCKNAVPSRFVGRLSPYIINLEYKKTLPDYSLTSTAYLCSSLQWSGGIATTHQLVTNLAVHRFQHAVEVGFPRCPPRMRLLLAYRRKSHHWVLT